MTRPTCLGEYDFCLGKIFSQDQMVRSHQKMMRRRKRVMSHQKTKSRKQVRISPVLGVGWL